jgi:hypothetical protein
MEHAQGKEKRTGLKTRHYTVPRMSSFFSTLEKSFSLMARAAPGTRN